MGPTPSLARARACLLVLMLVIDTLISSSAPEQTRSSVRTQQGHRPTRVALEVCSNCLL